MEFEVPVLGENYRFSLLNNSSVLVSCRYGEYILYKTKGWRCADDLPRTLVEELGEVIDDYLQLALAVK
jgi:hypothetical protein